MNYSTSLMAAPPFEDILYIMQHLRPFDRVECDSTSFGEEASWAALVHNAGSYQWAAYVDGLPVAIFGAAARWPGSWSCWCLGTADFPKVALLLARHIRRVAVPALFDAGMQRMDCYALADYPEAHKWCRFLGGTAEATLVKWGKNGETFIQYCWLRDGTKPLERTAKATVSNAHGVPVW